MTKILLLNSKIMTGTDRTYRLSETHEIPVKTAINEFGFESAIGHQSTATLISRALGIECPVNRIEAKQEIGQIAVICAPEKRAQEGHIFTAAELENANVRWHFLECFSIQATIITMMPECPTCQTYEWANNQENFPGLYCGDNEPTWPRRG